MNGQPRLNIQFPNMGKAYTQGAFIKGQQSANKLRELQLEEYPEEREHQKLQRMRDEQDRQRQIKQQKFKNFTTSAELGRLHGSKEIYQESMKQSGVENPPPLEFDKDDDGKTTSMTVPTEKGILSIKSDEEGWAEFWKYIDDNPKALESEKGLLSLGKAVGNKVDFKFTEKQVKPDHSSLMKDFLAMNPGMKPSDQGFQEKYISYLKEKDSKGELTDNQVVKSLTDFSLMNSREGENPQDAMNRMLKKYNKYTEAPYSLDKIEALNLVMEEAGYAAPEVQEGGVAGESPGKSYKYLWEGE